MASFSWHTLEPWHRVASSTVQPVIDSLPTKEGSHGHRKRPNCTSAGPIPISGLSAPICGPPFPSAVIYPPIFEPIPICGYLRPSAGRLPSVPICGSLSAKALPLRLQLLILAADDNAEPAGAPRDHR